MTELRNLAEAELLYVRGIAPEANYRFKHALIRDAAYEALLKSRRKELHRLVAHAIDEKFSGLRETHLEVLARHWKEAGERDQAIIEWSRAGEAARAGNAFREARPLSFKASSIFEWGDPAALMNRSSVSNCSAKTIDSISWLAGRFRSRAALVPVDWLRVSSSGGIGDAASVSVNVRSIVDARFRSPVSRVPFGRRRSAR
jgi:hypothetical protein